MQQVIVKSEVLRGKVMALQAPGLEPWVKVLIAGDAKSAGKTTFAMTGPGKKLHLAYDGGEPPAGIPGVDEGQVWTVQYSPSLQEVNPLSDKWKRPRNVGEEIFNDVQAIRNAFVKGEQEISFANGASCPLPDLLILDGITEMTTHILDWILAVNGKADTDDFENNFFPWRKRLDLTRGLVNMLSPMPCHIALVAWETRQMETTKDGRGRPVQVPTGRYVPDGGGKLDEWLPGKMYSAVRCYAEYQNNLVRHYVQLKSDGIRKWIGVRGRYDDIKAVDVTLSAAKPESGWRKVFGERGMFVRGGGK